ncbi:MAG TPA: Fis family transcriptional regulator [Gammaproteobacteria bacterium]|nr:Fis family transcriptional regulator [Gammaproteobacteria bacterium]
MRKKHIGSDFEDFLREEDRLEQSTAIALKRVIAWQLEQAMKKQHLTKNVVAKRMQTSRGQLDRLLDPGNPSVTLDTIARAAKAVGREVVIKFTA